MQQRSQHALGDDEDLAPLMGARQRRLGGEAPYRDDPVSTNGAVSQIVDCDRTAVSATCVVHY